MAFDAMAMAVDWLDAYRDGNFEAVVQMYAENAVVDCGCDRVVVTGKDGLRKYWVNRLKNYPALNLDDLQPSGDGATISYVSSNGLVAAVLEFDMLGRISLQRCGPAVARCD